MVLLTKKEIPEFINYLKERGSKNLAELLSLCLSKADGEPYYCPRHGEFSVIKTDRIERFYFPDREKEAGSILQSLKKGKPLEDFFEKIPFSETEAKKIYLSAILSRDLKVSDISALEDSSTLSQALLKAYTQYVHYPSGRNFSMIDFLIDCTSFIWGDLFKKGIAILSIYEEGNQRKYEVISVKNGKVNRKTYTIPLGRNLGEFAHNLANLPYQTDANLRELLRREIPSIITKLLETRE